MNDKQENKLSMCRATETVLDNNNAKWSAIVPFATAKTAFSGKIADLLLARDQQLDIITGIALDKKVLKDAVITIADNVAASVIDYATVNNNNQLLNSVKLSHSKLERARDEVVGGLCRNIFNHASDNAAALIPYGITALVLTDFDTAINNYETKVPEPRAAAADKKAITTAIRTLIKDTDNILKLRLDKLMVRFKTTEPQFYSSYKNARIIIDLGATHTKFRVLVKDAGGTAIPGATVSLLQNSSLVYSAVSDADGKISITKIAPGTYNIKTEKEGFATKLETGIQFKAGKQVKRSVTLVSGVTPPDIFPIIWEGDLNMGNISSFEMLNLDTDAHPNLTFIFENTSTSVLRFYAAAAANLPPASPVLDVAPDNAVPKTIAQMISDLGAGSTNHHLNVYNVGPAPAHFKVIIEE